MKRYLTNTVAVMLVLWYSVSVIGFDVHTCNGSGRTFIATVLSGTDCDDIHSHSEKEKSSGCCCCNDSHSCPAEEGVSSQSCCTDDWQMILLTGVRGVNHERDILASSVGPFTSAVIESTSTLISSYCLRCEHLHLVPKLVLCRDIHEANNVWRI